MGGRDLDPGAPVCVVVYLVGRGLDQDEDHVHLVGIAAGDDVVGGVVGEGEAAVGLDYPGAHRVGVPGVYVLAVVAEVEVDGDLTGPGDGLASDERRGGVGVGDIPQLDYEGCVPVSGPTARGR